MMTHFNRKLYKLRCLNVQQLYYCFQIWTIYFTLAPVYTCAVLALGNRRKVRTTMVLGGFAVIVGLYYYNQTTGSSTMANIATQCRRDDSSLSTHGVPYATPMNPRFFLDIQKMLFTSGIEHQPGPTSLRNFTLIVGNITCLNTHWQQVSNIEADAMVFQEHSCPPGEWAAMHKHMRKKRKRLILGRLDPEVKHNLGYSFYPHQAGSEGEADHAELF